LAACNRPFCSLAASEKRQNIFLKKYAAIFIPCQLAKLLDFGNAHVFGISSRKLTDSSNEALPEGKSSLF